MESTQTMAQQPLLFCTLFDALVTQPIYTAVEYTRANQSEVIVR